MSPRILTPWHSHILLWINENPLPERANNGKLIVHIFRKRWHPRNWPRFVREWTRAFRKHPLQRGRPIAIKLLFWLVLLKLATRFAIFMHQVL